MCLEIYYFDRRKPKTRNKKYIPKNWSENCEVRQSIQSMLVQNSNPIVYYLTNSNIPVQIYLHGPTVSSICATDHPRNVKHF